MTDSGRVVVIGTGPAGAAAAVFVSRAGLEPLVLEAGSNTASLGLTARVRGVTVAKLKPEIQTRQDLETGSDPSAELYETLAPGGLSNHWACAVPRFSQDDFTDAARAGELYTWPINYKDLEPWYERVEPLLRIAGGERSVANLPAGRVAVPRRLSSDWDPVVRLAAEHGRDVAVMPYAYGADTTLTRAATPFNAFTRLVEPAMRAGRMTVRFDAQAVSLEWDARTRRVTAVLVKSPRSATLERIPCRAVVLAAGAVNSAQILLESRSSELPSGIGNEHGNVGRYLHDHPLAKLVVKVAPHLPISPATYITRPNLERTDPLYAAAYMQWSGVWKQARSMVTRHPGRSDTLGFSIFGTMIPTADDSVSLVPGGPPGQRSKIRYSLKYPAKAVQVLEAAKQELIEILDRAGFRPEVEVFRVEAPGNSVHYGGTCRMHRSPELGVVDEYCRVHSARNVAVADSAVFTTGPEKNPVLTAMTLAARAGNRIAEELRSGDL